MSGSTQLEARIKELEAALDDCKNPKPPQPHASMKDWRDALLMQAREEVDAAWQLVGAKSATRHPAMSVFCMLMQMCFEKLGKAALAGSDPAAFRKHRFSHATASKLIHTLKRMRGHTLQYRWKAILPLVQELERAHPAIAKTGPHLEYPWEEPDGAGGFSVKLPSADLPIAKRLASPVPKLAPELLRLATELLDNWSTIFG